MANQSTVLFLVIRTDTVFFHKCKNTFQDLLIDRHAEGAVCIRDNTVRSPCIEPRNDIALFIRSNRELSFIPIVKWFIHPHNRFHHTIQQIFRHLANTHEIPPHFIHLKLQLTSIFHLLDLASATFPRHRTLRIFNTIFRRCKNIHQSCISIILLRLHDLSFHNITNDCILDKQRVSIHPADALTRCSHIFNCNRHHIIFLHKHTSFYHLGTGQKLIGDVVLCNNTTSPLLFFLSWIRTTDCTLASRCCFCL